VGAVQPRRANFRLHLRDGSTVIVRDAVVRTDSIVGVRWGSTPGLQIAVARTEVERIEVAKMDELRTVGLIVSLAIVVRLGLSILAGLAD